MSAVDSSGQAPGDCEAHAYPLAELTLRSARVDLGVKEGEHAAAAVAEDELASLLAVDEEDVAALLVAPLDGNFRLRSWLTA